MSCAADTRPCFTRPPQELIAPGGTGLPNDREKRAGETGMKQKAGHNPSP